MTSNETATDTTEERLHHPVGLSNEKLATKMGWTKIHCTGFGKPAKDCAYLSITRMDGTTERFALTQSIVALYAVEFAELQASWNE